MKFAYADPPYIGCSNRYPEKKEVDHLDLLRRLADEFPDGWALSASSSSLTELMHLVYLVKLDVRVMAWVKPFAVFKPNVNPAYAWEPVIMKTISMKMLDWLQQSPLDPVCVVLSDADWRALSASLPIEDGPTGFKVPYLYFNGVKVMCESAHKMAVV